LASASDPPRFFAKGAFSTLRATPEYPRPHLSEGAPLGILIALMGVGVAFVTRLTDGPFVVRLGAMGS
jgi:hypothetical protein